MSVMVAGLAASKNAVHSVALSDIAKSRVRILCGPCKVKFINKAGNF